MKLNEFINKATDYQIEDEVFALNHCVATEAYDLQFQIPTDVEHSIGPTILSPKNIRVNPETRIIEVELET